MTPPKYEPTVSLGNLLIIVSLFLTVVPMILAFGVNYERIRSNERRIAALELKTNMVPQQIARMEAMIEDLVGDMNDRNYRRRPE